jgi:phosphomannomutase/phosphoglucomutase
VTYFSTFHFDLDGAIMVTGSHNPSDYNGFKICVGRETLHGSDIQKLRQLMAGLNAEGPSANGVVCDRSIIPEYISYLAKSARPLRPMKIVIDSGNGTASTVAPALFERLGAQVLPLFCELDGRFPNHHPDPSVPANLKVLSETVSRENADFGVGFDGDSDRIGLVDETGRVVFGDELLVILARDILKEHPGATIISEVKSTHRLYDDIRAKGGKPLMWKAGHSLIKSKMRETGALLAGEISGHVFFADRYFGYDDAIYAALRVYEILSAHGGTLSSLLADLPDSMVTPEIRVECEEARKFQLVDEIKKLLSASHEVNDLDGVRIDFPDGWGLIRASNTQPALVLRFEAVSARRLDEIRGIIERALHSATQAIGHAPIRIESTGVCH